MRLYAFDDHQLGVLSAAGRLADITALVGPNVAPRDRMTALISGWAELSDDVRTAAGAPGGTALSDAHLLAPQPRPGKIIAAPVNYRLHQQEMGGAAGVYSGATVNTIETYAGFIKASSSIVGPDGVIELPPGDRRIDHEAELGIVIGRAARNVHRDDALEYVFGYVPLLDITMRGEEDRSFRKSFDTFTPIGPAIVTADEVGDPGELELALTVDGELRQSSNTREMIFDVPRLIELYSGAMTLEPGDLIATGTPEGVGPLEPGQEVTLEVAGVGRLVMSVRVRETALRWR
jgi:2-keto-4-pentenoate hydratase/2-oxohepta-3-ene-1,7-dioic acid hydratase in catechol pathway